MLEKFRKQLEGANDGEYQLAAELLYVQQFLTSLTGGDKKLETSRLSWAGAAPSRIPDWTMAGVAEGWLVTRALLFTVPSTFGCLVTLAPEALLAYHFSFRVALNSMGVNSSSRRITRTSWLSTP